MTYRITILPLGKMETLHFKGVNNYDLDEGAIIFHDKHGKKKIASPGTWMVDEE